MKSTTDVSACHDSYGSLSSDCDSVSDGSDDNVVCFDLDHPSQNTHAKSGSSDAAYGNHAISAPSELNQCESSGPSTLTDKAGIQNAEHTKDGVSIDVKKDAICATSDTSMQKVPFMT